MADKTLPIPSPNTPVVDRFRRWSPRWYNFFKPLLDTTRETVLALQSVNETLTASITTEVSLRTAGDTALASQITTVSASVAALGVDIDAVEASVTSEASARASADSALASDITTVSTSLNGVSTTVTNHTSSINGISAQWGVSIDVNGKVIGLTRLDGGATGSTFTVVADKFIVRHPTTTTDIQAFIVGLVNGVSTVGINGNLVVDDTILARHLSISELSELVSDAGIIVDGTLKDASNTYEFRIADGYFGRTDASSYIDMKNNVLQFTT